MPPRIAPLQRRPAERGHRWLLPAALALLVLLALLVVFRRQLADRLWPETRAQALREQAALALAQGRLSAADGSGARELYEAALALDPDRREARDGLVRVGQAALARARAALAARDYRGARDMLRLARTLQVPRPQSDALAADLREAEAAQLRIPVLLRDAAAARAEHRLDGAPDAALPLYARVLAAQPDRIEALEGREDALADLLQDARAALARGELVEAAATIASARTYDAGHADLPAAEAALATAREDLRRRAEADLRRGRLTRAGERFRLLLDVADDDAAARQGLERVAGAWARRASRLAADFRFGEAEAALAQARALAPQASGVAEAARHLARARQAQARPIAKPGAERARRVRRLLEEAAAAEARGDLLAPPGDSAYDKLRAARALAPRDAAVGEATARLRPAARDCFERELRGNRLGRARGCLDAWSVLGGSGAELDAARRRLALRWLAVGEERLRAGELAIAERALTTARALDPQAPGLAAFAERVRAASAGRQ
ncbi:MAG TPA: hypothetical protein VM576_00750 [Xanthomonadaceae bacterium]|nr:hypothetical protein [Xanthomonadaceae bacterium]